MDGRVCVGKCTVQVGESVVAVGEFDSEVVGERIGRSGKNLGR